MQHHAHNHGTPAAHGRGHDHAHGAHEHHGHAARAAPPPTATAGRAQVDLPDASGDRPRCARLLPDLRHGARAAHGHARGGRGRPPEGHDAALLGERHQPPARRHRDGRDDLGRGRPARGRRAGVCLGAVRACDTGRALGRLAVLRARLGVVPHVAAQHVQPDRAGRCGRLSLQRVRGARAGRAARGVQGARSRSALFRGGGRHHESRAARRGARSAGALGDLERGSRCSASRPTPRSGSNRTARSARCRSPR